MADAVPRWFVPRKSPIAAREVPLHLVTVGVYRFGRCQGSRTSAQRRRVVAGHGLAVDRHLHRVVTE